MQPTLVIGLGGTGAHVVSSLLATLRGDTAMSEAVGDTLQFVCVDTDMQQANSLSLPEWSRRDIGFYALPYIEQACRQDENLAKWFDCQMALFHFTPAQFDPRRGKTIYRQFGRLALYHDLATFGMVKESIRRSLSVLAQHSPHSPLIIICTSLIGGTGGAIALDIAYLARRVLGEERMNPYDGHILGVFALHNVFSSALAGAGEKQQLRFICNQVAAIQEIQYYAKTRYEFGPQGNVTTFDNLEPFNSYWIFGGDSSRSAHDRWPHHWFPLIAAEMLAAMVAGDWIAPSTEHVTIQVPMTTVAIDDWSHWERIYHARSKDSHRLSPHISHEFDSKESARFASAPDVR